jgi:hypothetical protein
MVVPFEEFGWILLILAGFAFAALLGYLLGLWRGQHFSRRAALACIVLGAAGVFIGGAIGINAVFWLGIAFIFIGVGAAGPAQCRSPVASLLFSLVLGGLLLVVLPSALLLFACARGDCI